MQVTAKSSKSFLFRMALLAIFCNGGALWFLYDGTVTYPQQRERALKYIEYKEKDQLDQWREYATEQGWDLEDPGEPKDDIDFLKQYIMAGFVAPFGLLFLIVLIRASRRWIELNETGIRTSWGRQLEFDQIVALDKKKWKTKGIAKIVYEDNGRKRRVVLDDCKYTVEPTKAILIEVESRIGYDKIVGGPPEALQQDPSEEALQQDPSEEALQQDPSEEGIRDE